MNNPDYILDLLDWSNNSDEQARGIEMARGAKDITVFILPCDKKHNKNVWENCAKVLSERNDAELAPYLVKLLEWLQDINWPGAFCILDRMRRYADSESLGVALNYCILQAQTKNDVVWERNLHKLS